MLYIDLRPGQTCYSKVMHRKEMTHSDGPQDPRLNSPAEWKRSAAIARGTGGQYVAVCSVSNSPLTHNPFATLSNKVWEVYFSKEVCSFVIIVDYVSACICIHIVVSRLYNTWVWWQWRGTSHYAKFQYYWNLNIRLFSVIVGYSMPNPLFTYILNIYNLVWLGFMAY